MICPKCGTVCAENCDFCPVCGFVYWDNSANGEGYRSAALGGIKGLASSAYFLFATLFYSVSIVFNIIYSSIGYNNFVSYLYKLARELQMEKELYPIIYLIPTRNIPAAILMQSIPLLLAVGLWLTFAFAKRKKGFKTVGLSIIKTALIIHEVLASVLVAAVAIGSIGVIIRLVRINKLSRNVADMMPAIEFGIILFAAALIALVVFYYTKAIKSINAVIVAVKDGDIREKASSFVGVFCYISAIITALNLNGSPALLMLSGICIAISTILFGMILFKYNDMQNVGFAPMFSLNKKSINQDEKL